MKIKSQNKKGGSKNSLPYFLPPDLLNKQTNISLITQKYLIYIAHSIRLTPRRTKFFLFEKRIFNQGEIDRVIKCQDIEITNMYQVEEYNETIDR